MVTEENRLEKICPYAGVCPESNYGNDEICSDYKTCKKYLKDTHEFLSEKGNITFEKLSHEACLGITDFEATEASPLEYDS